MEKTIIKIRIFGIFINIIFILFVIFSIYQNHLLKKDIKEVKIDTGRNYKNLLKVLPKNKENYILQCK